MVELLDALRQRDVLFAEHLHVHVDHRLVDRIEQVQRITAGTTRRDGHGLALAVAEQGAGRP